MLRACVFGLPYLSRNSHLPLAANGTSRGSLCYACSFGCYALLADLCSTIPAFSWQPYHFLQHSFRNHLSGAPLPQGEKNSGGWAASWNSHLRNHDWSDRSVWNSLNPSTGKEFSGEREGEEEENQKKTAKKEKQLRWPIPLRRDGTKICCLRKPTNRESLFAVYRGRTA